MYDDIILADGTYDEVSMFRTLFLIAEKKGFGFKPWHKRSINIYLNGGDVYAEYEYDLDSAIVDSLDYLNEKHSDKNHFWGIVDWKFGYYEKGV